MQLHLTNLLKKSKTQVNKKAQLNKYNNILLALDLNKPKKQKVRHNKKKTIKIDRLRIRMRMKLKIMTTREPTR